MIFFYFSFYMLLVHRKPIYLYVSVCILYPMTSLNLLLVLGGFFIQSLRLVFVDNDIISKVETF